METRARQQGSFSARLSSCAIRVLLKRRLADSAALVRHYRRWFGAPAPIAALYRLTMPIELTDEPVSGEWLGNRKSRRLLIYLHGGGYVSCSPATHRPITAALTKLLGCTTFVHAYPLAPEHPFPAALESVMRAYAALAAARGPENIMLAGDSAGGGLVCALMMALRDRGIPLPARAVCFSPWTNLVGADDHERQSTSCAMFHPEHVPLTAAAYLAGHDPLDPLASPIHGNFTGFPPMLLQASRDEMLFSDSVCLSERMRKQGIDVRMSAFAGVPHGWQMLYPWLREARQALLETAEFLKAE